MPDLLTHSTTELQSIQEWFTSASSELFQAKREQKHEMARVRLHVAAQSAHRIAAEIEQFLDAYQALQRDGMIADC